MRQTATLLLLACIIGAASAKVYFEEKFDDTWDKRWKKSSWKKSSGEAGDWVHTAGEWYGDAEADKGIKTTPDARFYSIYAEFDDFSNKDKDLVLQFSAKHEQKLDCGGGYIKLLPSGVDMENFGGSTPYSIMFGPDICGFSTRKVHVILTHNETNHLINKNIPCETDELTHVYTLILHSNNTYKVLIDNEQKEEGSLYEDWEILKPKTIKDPSATKPEDWDERAQIPDPEDKKPEGHDDIPEYIPDPKATKPEDWDDEDDGEWEPPTIMNPEFKGEWNPKMIDNPAYKGIWVAPDIPNPEYVHSDDLYSFPSLKYVGFELWQVKAGSIFDNVLVTDDVAYAKQFAEDTWGKNKAGEKEMYDKVQEEQKAKEEEEKEQEDDSKASVEEEDDYDEESDAAPSEGKDEL